MNKRLFLSDSLDDWQAALQTYGAVIERQGVERLPELDRWYRDEFPKAMDSRTPSHATLPELVRVTEWKMARGVWRGRNLHLVRGKEPEQVEASSVAALAAAPHPTSPIATLAKLAGVGPATASAVMAAARPDVYPFFDELVAAQVPGLGPVVYTLGYYNRYAQSLRDRAAQLGREWTPVQVERALWANAGGKAGTD